jgi:membrane fusion protein (multidrug efflux system)
MQTQQKNAAAEQPPSGAEQGARDGRGDSPGANQPGATKAMRPAVSVIRRLAIVLIAVAALAIGGVVGFAKMGHARQGQTNGGDNGLSAAHVKAFIVGKFESLFHKEEEEAPHHEHGKILVTCPKVQDVVFTDSFVCQIRSQRHIEVRALEGGYLNKISLKEGQAVKAGHVMFEILPILYKARLDAEVAEAQLAQLELNNTKRLFDKKVVSENQVKLLEAKLAKATAKAELAKAEWKFTEVKAPFDGIVDRLLEREGSLVKDGDILTTLADNSVMWVYFNVPEKYYLDYMRNREQREKEDKIELMLANGDIFQQTGKIGAIEADFNNENGNIKFRADYPNPRMLLRHGQTGTIKIRRPLKNALLIPQRATFERLDKRYVWVVGEDHVAHQSLITTSHELEDIFVVASGLKVTDKIVLEGVREVEEGGKVEYEYCKPEVALKDLKFHAE